MFRRFLDKLMLGVGRLMLRGAHSRLSGKEFLEKELQKWEGSRERLMQIKGFLYYEDEHDILARKRTMIGRDGGLEAVENLPNNHVIDNQYAKLVNQKVNYLFGQPVAFHGENERYVELLHKTFNRRIMRVLKNSAKAAYNGGIAWLHPYYTEEGEFMFRLFPAYEVLPFWKDDEHTALHYAVRMYPVIGLHGTSPELINKVEVYGPDGVHKFIYDRGSLIPDVMDEGWAGVPYVTVEDGKGNVTGLNWSRIPLIPVRCSGSETPLLKRVKPLQDGINAMLSDFENNMQEDARNTILVLKNYDGQDLGEFRKNLATYGVVKVRVDDSAKGGVETLEVKVNAENYKAIVEMFKKAIIENGMGYDAKDDRLSGNPNQMNIQSMYSDIDSDADDAETEYQAAFEDILWFVNAHFSNTGQGDFEGEKIEVIFNRDVLINETETIDNCQKSMGILSLETVLSMHPWVDDVQKEMERLKEQRLDEQKELEGQYNPFMQPGQDASGEDDGGLNEEEKP